MNEVDELLPCPYCDKKVEWQEIGDTGVLYIACAECELDYGYNMALSPPELAQRWNEMVRRSREGEI